MTSAIICILVVLSVLLFVHLCVIVILLFNQRRSSAQVYVNHEGYLVVYASQSGHVEHYAKQFAHQLQQSGQLSAVLDLQYLSISELTSAKKILWCVSTYGEGDAPDTARAIAKKMLVQSLDLSEQQYAVLAFGDRRYPQFCAFGQRLDQWLKTQQAQPLFEMICVNVLNPRDLEQWQAQIEQLTEIKLNVQAEHQTWQPFQLQQRKCLNTGSSGLPIFQLQLHALETMHWQSGDIFEVQCGNAEIEIQSFLKAHAIADDILHQPELKQQLRHNNLRHIPLRLVDEAVEAWVQRFDPLPSRDYSIASIPEQGYVELVIRQQQTEHGLGLGSGWLTAALAMGENISAKIRSNPSFHLVQQQQALILIGNGTGIAGLMSHLHQREHWQQQRNWLIFGERQQQYDHLYAEQLQHWQQRGFLTDLDYAFSRDQQQKIYVQDRLLQKADQLRQWIADGAAIYVCGSLSGMAQQVEQVLIQILGETQLEQLREQHRYQRDVY
ncbi:sulfite reductase subunit alpha [Acinetobacter ursingii]|uniref:sulfite reductase subunit alpha n=1 Tax=Acinetobacter ursingii TaxID=108980 RepID=UPI0021CD9375|nr:sulfite reductase subunit alpha [Acinetobacter ursingii]MCU4481702.1 sulfite reductase subunit alpha [Acinetobacter ursingii]MCU4505979.1 sulfite reductase subunit alpha [Acinetobacter ursingii]MCU4568844.1 sulfite reductase subunit alpha [Acinetobacter ursingii]